MKNEANASTQKEMFEQDGYLIVKGLFSKEEVEQLKVHFMEMHVAGPIPGHFSPLSEEEANGDILKRFPRIMHPHKVDHVSMNYMLDSRVFAVLTNLTWRRTICSTKHVLFQTSRCKRASTSSRQLLFKNRTWNLYCSLDRN